MDDANVCDIRHSYMVYVSNCTFFKEVWIYIEAVITVSSPDITAFWHTEKPLFTHNEKDLLVIYMDTTAAQCQCNPTVAIAAAFFDYLFYEQGEGFIGNIFAL
jgi:hypothetical protein